MNVVSLFSGIGGFDLAFERAGARVLVQSEIDDHCNVVLCKRFPDAINLGDVARIRGSDAGGDVICGGFPCQDISAAGKRAGLEGERSKLWWEFARILDEAHPEWCLIENVPGLLSSNGGRDFGAVLGTLVDLGYGVAWRVLDASGFGVPQRRRRVFIVGCAGDARRAGEILFEQESSGGDSGSGDTSGTSAAGTVAPRALSTSDGLLAEHGLVSALSARMGTAGHGDVANAAAGWLIPFRKSTRAHGPDDSESWEEAGYANALDAEGNVTRTAHAIAYSVYPTSGQGSELNAREIDVATTLSATDGSLHERGTRIVEDLDVRRLMPIECERLQGFPDGWTEGHPDTHRYRMLGNAVAVPVVEWIARRIVESYSLGKDGGAGSKPEPATEELPRASAPNHCAKFSDALLPVAVKMLRDAGLEDGAKVLDPFAGTGKGVDYLRAEGFDAWGIELEPEWANCSKHVVVGNALNLFNAFPTKYRGLQMDAIFTSPTFGNRMADRDMRESVAGTYAKSLGRAASVSSSCHLQWGREYRIFHLHAWRNAVASLKDGGLFLLNIKDHPRNNELQRVPEWHCEVLEGLGLTEIAREFVKTPGNKRGTNKHKALDGEWLILFRKGGE